MKNQSGQLPKGKAVLKQEWAPERKVGSIVIPENVETKMAMVNTRAMVVAIGPAAWDDEKEPRAQVGDLVLVTQYAGMMAIGPKDKKQYRLVNDRDIYCQVVDQGEEA